MKNNTKSSITLPTEELLIVEDLMKTLKLKSKVDVIRKGLSLLKESTDRQKLRSAYQKASQSTRASTLEELSDLDHLTSEGLDEN